LYQALHEIAVQNGTVPASAVAAAPPASAAPTTQLAPNVTPKVLATNEPAAKKAAKKKTA
jgi:hypothetical protein